MLRANFQLKYVSDIFRAIYSFICVSTDDSQLLSQHSTTNSRATTLNFPSIHDWFLYTTVHKSFLVFMTGFFATVHKSGSNVASCHISKVIFSGHTI